MSKTKEELKELKQEFETLNNKLKELTEDELKQVTGGIDIPCIDGKYKLNNDVDLNNPWSPPSNNIVGNLTGDFTGNNANGNGGGVFNEGEF